MATLYLNKLNQRLNVVNCSQGQGCCLRQLLTTAIGLASSCVVVDGRPGERVDGAHPEEFQFTKYLQTYVISIYSRAQVNK